MKVYGVMGDGRVAKSLSPRMHNSVLRKLGLSGVYMAFAVAPDELEDVVSGFKSMGLGGVNVTVPHKQTVIPHLEGLSDEARALGAVNTLLPKDGGLLGHNTDVGGFARSLEDAGFDPMGKRALVFGAGGAARAVVLALQQGGAAEVRVAARRQEQARDLCGQLGGSPFGLEASRDLAEDAQLLVNATSVSSPVESSAMEALVQDLPAMPGLELVVDVNYGRTENFWANAAEVRRVPFRDGLGMLAHQARLSFSIWTGCQPEIGEFMGPLRGLQ